MITKRKLNPHGKKPPETSPITAEPTAEQVAAFAAGATPPTQATPPELERKPIAVMCRLPSHLVSAIDKGRKLSGISRNAFISQILADWTQERGE